MITRYAIAFPWVSLLSHIRGAPSSDKLDIKTTFKPTSCPITSRKDDKLAMLYVGTLASDGARFDANEDPKNPFEFRLGAGQVIKGWDQGLLEFSHDPITVQNFERKIKLSLISRHIFLPFFMPRQYVRGRETDTHNSLRDGLWEKRSGYRYTSGCNTSV
ncbi:hypothetical protein CROQUDRAFT_663061 [Cronartium quercuum f. sp. fusiforme G11]|uniref:peptidylprolyl isomerase n=1 Tax=Cronartium quercuum f. sp. fusiforme G11 TaxID=708437 RepID=A0A9P6N8S5_9BASI|nr:hypothetical protein CROQUDRAFT_663061 [Cronartium quercuum f. sp. fusiforme G11]